MKCPHTEIHVHVFAETSNIPVLRLLTRTAVYVQRIPSNQDIRRAKRTSFLPGGGGSFGGQNVHRYYVDSNIVSCFRGSLNHSMLC